MGHWLARQRWLSYRKWPFVCLTYPADASTVCFMNFELWPISQIGIELHNVLLHFLCLVFVCVHYVLSLTWCFQFWGQKLQIVSTVICKKTSLKMILWRTNSRGGGCSCQNQQIMGKTNSTISQRRKGSLCSLSSPLFSLHQSHTGFGSPQYYNKHVRDTQTHFWLLPLSLVQFQAYWSQKWSG